MKICEICNQTKDDSKFNTVTQEVSYKLEGKDEIERETSENVCDDINCIVAWKKETRLVLWKVVAMKTMEPELKKTYTLEEVCGIINMLMVSQGAPPVKDETQFEQVVPQFHKAWKMMRGNVY